MGRVAIVTDSNSGITQTQAGELGIHIIPMPFYINGKLYYEDLTLSQEEFYQHLNEKAEISTSMPAMPDVTGAGEQASEDVRCGGTHPDVERTEQLLPDSTDAGAGLRRTCAGGR